MQAEGEIYWASEGMQENWKDPVGDELGQPLAVVGHETVCKSTMPEERSSHSY